MDNVTTCKQNVCFLSKKGNFFLLLPTITIKYVYKFRETMKVLLLNGSPQKNGNTAIALSEAAQALQSEGIETQLIGIGVRPVQGCIACNKCAELGRCTFHDAKYDEVREACREADGIIIGSPVFYAGPNGSLCALLDRLFYSASDLLAYKPAASVAVCRRGGASATFDRLNKYFTINNMPVVSSQYWNMVYGCTPGEARQDAEGLQTMRTLGRNMAWLLKSIHAAGLPQPQAEAYIGTNFIR
jgi:multimeric flavodoxin WrbA